MNQLQYDLVIVGGAAAAQYIAQVRAYGAVEGATGTAKDGVTVQTRTRPHAFTHDTSCPSRKPHRSSAYVQRGYYLGAGSKR
jgi:hypothetical protein